MDADYLPLLPGRRPATITLSPSDKEAAEESAHAVRVLESLNRFGPFRQFMADLEKRAAELAAQVLDGNMEHAERERLRVHRQGIMEVLRKPALDISGHCKVLEAMGRGPGHPDDL